MDLNISSEFSKVPQNSRDATKRVMELLIHEIYPVLQRLHKKLQTFNDYETEDEIARITNVYKLSSSQIKKCMVDFLDIIKLENKKSLHLQDGRKFIFERLSWCTNKLLAVENSLDKCKLKENIRQDLTEDPMFATPMYFVNWIDYTFEILGKLAEDVCRTDYKNDNSVFEEWKGSMVEHVTSLHMCIDELLLSAMTLCKYCLPEDQTILRARCQVVLRETKVIFGELIDEDISTAVKVTKEKLKLPIMPFNVNMMIDVLKDVLYVLETNTNTALLALLIHCYVNSVSPVDILKDHFSKKEDNTCCHTSLGDIDNCSVVENFDLYNERLQQIGTFAMSCSSDQNRILTLRSCLSTLESLDPHLVPSITTSPSGHHSEILAKFWKQEVQEIRDIVFLIVDPVAFVEKCKQYIHDLLLERRQQECKDSGDLWVVISIGRMVYDFFATYEKYEPEAIARYKNLDQQLKDVYIAQKEAKIVATVLSEKGAFINGFKTKLSRDGITIDTLFTRVRLVYSMVKRVYELIRPKDIDEQLFGEEEIAINRNATHTIHNNINTDTYTHCGGKPEPNFTRSVFARTGVKTSTRNIFLSKLTSHLKLKRHVQEELSFSAQVSELFNVERQDKQKTLNIDKFTEKCSLRKMMMKRQRQFPFVDKLKDRFDSECFGGNGDETENKERVFDRTESLQISEILHQINDLTSTISFSGSRNKGSFKKVANTPAGSCDISGRGLSSMSNVTQPSDFTTLERINDLDLVESKLSSLRTNSEFETHL